MVRSKKGKVSFFLLGTVLLIVAFFLGKHLGEEERGHDLGNKAMESFLNELSALQYLEKGNNEGARVILLQSLEGRILDMKQYAVTDVGKDGRSKIFARFAAIRSTYAPINYGDNGNIKKEIDECLKKN